MPDLPALNSALVRILLVDDRPPPQVMGAGFLISPRHILTCAHVIADALRLPRDTASAPADPLWWDLPLLEGARPLKAKLWRWYPLKAATALGELEDIAVLELDPEVALPSAARPAPLLALQETFDRTVRMCGFPPGMDAGDWVSGQLQGLIANGWVQLDPALGRRGVAPGFSGTPVWDKQENAVIGMIVGCQTRAGDTSAYMIPVARLMAAWMPTRDDLEKANREFLDFGQKHPETSRKIIESWLAASQATIDSIVELSKKGHKR